VRRRQEGLRLQRAAAILARVAARKIQGAARLRMRRAAERVRGLADVVPPVQLHEIFVREIEGHRDRGTYYLEFLMMLGAAAAGVTFKYFTDEFASEFEHDQPLLRGPNERLLPPAPPSPLAPEVTLLLAPPAPVLGARSAEVARGFESSLSTAVSPRVLAAMVFLIVATVFAIRDATRRRSVQISSDERVYDHHMTGCELLRAGVAAGETVVMTGLQYELQMRGRTAIAQRVR
jgi:hypothetical protein